MREAQITHGSYGYESGSGILVFKILYSGFCAENQNSWLGFLSLQENKRSGFFPKNLINNFEEEESEIIPQFEPVTS
jgi:hypothetical protein